MKKMKKILALAVWIAALGLLCASCDNGLDIQQAYTFSLETMPVQKRISVGETAEIRCTLVREGRYDGARYTIRYFQPDGRGELRMDDGTVFLPNDRYPLDREVFRLYYTSRSDDQQTSTSMSRTTRVRSRRPPSRSRARTGRRKRNDNGICLTKRGARHPGAFHKY